MSKENGGPPTVAEVHACTNCGSKDYRIQQLYVGYRQTLFIVDCSECRYDLIPLLIDWPRNQEELCRQAGLAWNKYQESVLAERTSHKP